MNSFAISTCLLQEASDDKIVCTGILNRIIDHTTPYKVVVDKKGIILDLYTNMVKTNKSYETAVWIKHLTTDPKQIEYLDIDFDKENYDNEIMFFIETASKIRNKKQIIVSNHSSIPIGYNYDNDSNTIKHNNEVISVYNKSEAITKLESKNKITNKSKEVMTNQTTKNTFNFNFKSPKFIITIIIMLLSALGIGYKYSSQLNAANEKCEKITIIGVIDAANQKKIKSVSIEEQTYTEDRTVVNGVFEFRDVPPINSTQMTLIVKYEGLKDLKIIVSFRGLKTNEDCILDLGRQH